MWKKKKTLKLLEENPEKKNIHINFEVGNYILNKTFTVQTKKKNTGRFEFNIVETSVCHTQIMKKSHTLRMVSG